MKNTLNKIYKYKMQMKQLNAPRKKLVITRFLFFFSYLTHQSQLCVITFILQNKKS